MNICPLCNALFPLDVVCAYCGAHLLDGGRLADYSDAYGPYTVQTEAGGCVHLLYCPFCRRDQRFCCALVDV